MVIRHVLIKPGGGRKFVVEPVHENGDVTLFLVLYRVVCGKFSGGRNQKLLKIGRSNLPPILDGIWIFLPDLCPRVQD